MTRKPRSLSGPADGRGHVLVFDGESQGYSSNELWAWEESDWRLLSDTPPVPPSGLHKPVLAEPTAVPEVVARGTTGIDPRLVPA